jgi:hypothetical protein
MTEPVVTTEPTASKPEPVVKAAVVWGGVATFAMAVIGVLVSVGKLTDEQAKVLSYSVDYVTNNIPVWGGLLVGLFSVFSGGAAAAATAAVGRRKVTPVREARVHAHRDI